MGGGGERITGGAYEGKAYYEQLAISGATC